MSHSLSDSFKHWMWIPELTARVVVQDVGVEKDCINVVEQSIEFLGGLDIIVSNAVRISFLSLFILVTSTVVVVI
jgi:NAD(P)-dependent dehydrogenase (short-subunit alcohol dehydrogenase family)